MSKNILWVKLFLKDKNALKECTLKLWKVKSLIKFCGKVFDPKITAFYNETDSCEKNNPTGNKFISCERHKSQSKLILNLLWNNVFLMIMLNHFMITMNNNTIDCLYRIFSQIIKYKIHLGDNIILKVDIQCSLNGTSKNIAFQILSSHTILTIYGDVICPPKGFLFILLLLYIFHISSIVSNSKKIVEEKMMIFYKYVKGAKKRKKMKKKTINNGWRKKDVIW